MRTSRVRLKLQQAQSHDRLARHFGTELGTPNSVVFALAAAKSVRRTLFDPMMRTSFVSTSRSPWQNPYVERLIGTLRRDCLGHVLILGAGS